MVKARDVRNRALAVTSGSGSRSSCEEILQSLQESHRNLVEKILEEREHWRSESKKTELIVS
jgi:hypothetical protein